jgi:hypothetical protein
LAFCLFALLCSLTATGSTTEIKPALLVQEEFTDHMGTTYHLYDIIQADLNDDGQREQVVLYKGQGTSSPLSYQVWHLHEGNWHLWHEQEGLYQGVIEIRGTSLVERVPIYKKDDANALPSAYRERTYIFPGGISTLVEEKEGWIQRPQTSGGWQNPPRQEIEEMIREAALLMGIPPVIVKAVAYTESNLRQFSNGEPLLSSDGLSWGIMQVSPHAHPEYDVERLKYDIRYNIRAGTEILREKWGWAFAGTRRYPGLVTTTPASWKTTISPSGPTTAGPQSTTPTQPRPRSTRKKSSGMPGSSLGRRLPQSPQMNCLRKGGHLHQRYMRPPCPCTLGNTVYKSLETF